jgi:4-amino-4-deoxy-L-arabinose transferase-like glycosyltransferase
MKRINTNRWFWIFASVHLFIWTLVPSLVRFNLPLDAMEGTTWGQHFALGYDKNPFMNAWLTELAVWLGDKHDWMIYLFSQITVVICFFAIWRLAKKILSPVHALIAVFLLEFVATYNIDSIDFNDNVLELAFWALMSWFFYVAIKKQKIRDWILVGLFTGCAMMAKYYVVVLLAPMLLFLLLNKEARVSFMRPGLYIAVLVFLVFVLPHVVWLFGHDFITVQYAFARTAAASGWQQHVMAPLNFMLPDLEAWILPLIAFGVLFLRGKNPIVIATQQKITSFQWQFLLLMGFGPLIVTMLIPLFSGANLHNGWGAVLMSLWGVVLLALTQPRITKVGFYRFVAFLFTVMFIALVAYGFSMLKAGDTSSATFPGRIMAKSLTQQWHDKYHTKLAYLVGPRFEGGSVAYYSKDRPAVYIDANNKVSFWIDEKDLKQKGAVFLWLKDKAIKKTVLKRFPKLTDIHTVKFNWQGVAKALPYEIEVGFLPPMQ